MMLARMLKAYRMHEKLSLRKMARIIGIDHTTLYRFESGDEIASSAWSKIALWVYSKEIK